MSSFDLTFCELREKEVINVVDGKRLGRVIDLAFTVQGCVKGIIVPGERRIFKNISGNDCIYISWKKIIKIGQDVILVELSSAGNVTGSIENNSNS
ncbi:MAG: YlmC/YmxH family sporulation protein [Clostridia bacterium]